MVCNDVIIVYFQQKPTKGQTPNKVRTLKGFPRFTLQFDLFNCVGPIEH